MSKTSGYAGLAAALWLPCLLWAALAPQAGAQEQPTAGVPQELVGIQTQYFRALEAVEEKHRGELTQLHAAYRKRLQALGRHYVQSSDQASALAVKLELKRLDTPASTMPTPGIQPPRDLVDIREAFEEKKFQIKENERQLMVDLAKKYLSQLEVWSKLYRSKGKPESAKAVEREIKRMQASLNGETPGAPAEKAAAPATADAAGGTKKQDAEESSGASAPAGAADPVDAALTAAVEDEPALPTDSDSGASPAEVSKPSPVPMPGVPKLPDTLTLNSGWQQSSHSNRELAAELNSILSPYGKAEANLSTFPGLMLYGRVRYLMPWNEAREVLELAKEIPETGVIQTPGWPGADSLKFYRYQGKFDGFYTHMIVVCDAADHVVSLQLTNESSGMNMQYRPLLPEWNYYDYVLGRQKQIQVEGVWHKIFSRNLLGEFVEETDNVLNPNTPCLRIDTIYFDANLAVKSWGRWYIARPFLDTLVYTSKQAQ